ncbi:hypothetical protein MMC11_005399 [Xylographa trunciseda]|nr:hypothetical protein [Xylographa trunciseda]
MPSILELGHVLVPVTAAAIANLGSKILLLVGEGRRLKVFDNGSKRVLRSLRVFKSQSVHGIQCQWDEEAGHLVCLVWGGKAITLLLLKLDTSDSCAISLTEELLTDDWISHSCFFTNFRHLSDDLSSLPRAIFLTSHNVLYTLKLDSSPQSRDPGKLSCELVAAGPFSVLYSAHVVVIASGQALVTAGTVFGEVLVWSTDLGAAHDGSDVSIYASMLCTFRGHEGSVFGVTIAETPSTMDHSLSSHIVASCSDDRTIRIWDALTASSGSTKTGTETGFRSQLTKRDPKSERCLASTMGHLSRIWSLGFLSCSDEAANLISFGEDSTSQTWQIVKKFAQGTSTNTNKPHTYEIRHDESYAYHIGKNIWAAAVDLQKNNVSQILTGGADGRIVSYSIPNFDVQKSTANVSLLRRSANKERSISRGPSKNNPSQPLSPAERAFSAIHGQWHLHRVLESANLAYPSGLFKGTASLTQRPPTDDKYDAEYLYVEEGELTTQTGLAMRGSRRYVYRLQRASRSITAWFVKADTVSSVDYLFHRVEFSNIAKQMVEDELLPIDSVSTAKGNHLCINDDYVAEYKFQYKDGSLSQWYLKYTVKGPKKDYTASASYTRTAEADGPSAESMDMVQERDLIRGQKSNVGSDTFKNYCWIGRSEVIATTASGCIYLGTFDGNDTTGISLPIRNEATKSRQLSWCLVDQIPELHSYSIAVSVSDHTVILGAANGNLYCYQRSSQEVVALPNLSHKISGLFAEELENSKKTNRNVAAIACCVGDTTAYYFSFITDDAKLEGVSAFVKLTMPTSFIVTSVCFTAVENLLILGPISALCCVRQIHVDDAITTIKSVPKDDPEMIGNFLLTAGCDGKLALHRVHTRQEDGKMTVKLERVHTTVPPLGPNLEGACFTSENQDLLLWGFRSTDFVVWNETKRIEVMRVPCGGAHRSWAYSPSDDGQDGGVFIWTKASICNVQAQSTASHRVLQPGGHGREIKAIAICPLRIKLDSEYGYLVATAAEDTTIRISHAIVDKEDSSQAMRCLGVISKHNTGIQQLQWSSDGRYLFSAAGLEEFYVWRIQRVPCLGIGFLCSAQCPKVTEYSDLRITGFDVEAICANGKMEHDRYAVAMAYSDSTIRVRNSTPQAETFSSLVTGMVFGYKHVRPRLQATLLGHVPKLLSNTDQVLTAW